MHLLDLINGTFELVGGLTGWLNCVKLYKDKKVMGVFPVIWLFYTSWGIWNLYYYPSLNQWASFYGGLAIVSANITWVSLWLYYRNK